MYACAVHSLARNRGKERQMAAFSKRKREAEGEGEGEALAAAASDPTIGTADGGKQEAVMPQKKYYRMRAHINPLCDNFGNLD